MKTVLAIATCYNRKEKTINAIRQLEENNDCKISFIIVDDNSSDGTAEKLNDIKSVELIHGNGCLFYAGGMRKGIESAINRNEKYDYCLFFNDDVDFFQHSIDKLIEIIDYELLVGPTCDDNGTLSYGGKLKESIVRPKLVTVMGTNEKLEIDTFNCNCVLIPWNIFLTLGNMDEIYTHSMADLDYGFKAKRMGLSVKVAPFFVGECNDNPIAGGWSDKNLDILTRIRLKETPKGLPWREWYHFLHKNYGFITSVSYSIIPYLRILLKK